MSSSAQRVEPPEPFTCRRAQGCGRLPGPQHYRHVAVAVAAALPGVPDEFLAEAPMADVTTFVALAANPRTPLGRLLDALEVLSPAGPDTGGAVVATSRLCTALLGRADLDLEAVVRVATHRVARLGEEEMALAFSHPAAVGQAHVLVAAVWQAAMWSSWTNHNAGPGPLMDAVFALGGPASVVCHHLARVGQSGVKVPTYGAALSEAVGILAGAGPVATEVACGLAEEWAGSLEELVEAAICVAG